MKKKEDKQIEDLLKRTEILNGIKIRRRKRKGCDICKKDVPTEKFIGYCYNVLWICQDCFSKILK